MTTLTKRYNLSMVHLIPEDYVGEEVAKLHGHDFKVEVSVRGEPDPESGVIISRQILDAVVGETLIAPFDKKLINSLLSHGTGEILVTQFLHRLRQTPLGSAVLGVQIVETKNNRFESVSE